MSFTLTQLAKPGNPVGAVSAGGSLAASTIYHYRIFAFGYSADVIYSTIQSPPSDEVTVTTTLTDKTVTLSWDAVAGATRYLIVRIVDGSTYSNQEAMFISSAGAPLVINALTYVDTGAPVVKYGMWYEFGMPHIEVDAGTSETFDTMYTWAVAGGYTNFFTKIDDIMNLRSIFYRLTGWLWIKGTLNCANASHLRGGTSLFIDGGWQIEPGGVWNIGYEKFNNVYYFNIGMHITRTGKYSVLYANGTQNWNNVSYEDIALADQVYIGKTSVSHAVLRSSAVGAKQYFRRCLFPYLSLGEFYDTTPNAYIEDCIWSGLGTPNGMSVIKNTIVNTGAGVYNYYTTKDIYMKGIVFKQETLDIQFHKNGTLNNFYFVDGAFFNNPPKGTKSGNPSNMIVYKCKSCKMLIIDTEGAAIAGVRLTITDNLGNKIIMVSNGAGNVFRASGTATSGGASTLTDNNLSLGINEAKTHLLEIIGGLGVGQEKVIASNTADTFTIEGTWTTNPNATSIYRVESFLKTDKYQGNAALPNPYPYDHTDYNPFTFKFEKQGYATAILSGVEVTDALDWTITLSRSKVLGQGRLS